MAIMIPEATPLTGPEVKKVFLDELSKDHIYKIIEYRRHINKNNPDWTKFMRTAYLKKIFPDDYA